MFARVGRTATLALVFIGLGFFFIFMGWYGSAGHACVDCQIPYLISGGAAGLAFIGLGSGLLIFESGRRAVARLELKLEQLADAIQPGSATANGNVDAPKAAPLPETISVNGLVVVGRSSFHRPDCRLVAGKEDVDYAPGQEALDRGLQPCRVCDPLGAPKTVAKKR